MVDSRGSQFPILHFSWIIVLSFATLSSLGIKHLPTYAADSNLQLSWSQEMQRRGYRENLVEPISQTKLAQVPPILREPSPPSQTFPLPQPPQPLPPLDDLLKPPPQFPSPPKEPSGNVPDLIRVGHFKFKGNTVFSSDRLADEIAEFTKNPISFAQLLQARSKITQLYLREGYISSGAFLPQQDFEDGGEVEIEIVEGELEAINVTGTRHLNRGYVSSRLAIAGKPLNQNRLLQALQLLRLNPLIDNISARLSASPNPGKSVLDVEVREATTFSSPIILNNGRSPSVGSFRRGIQLNEANLLGFGDSLSVAYTNTDGSNALDFSYTLPLSPRNTTLGIAYGTTTSNVIEKPFDILNIESKSRYYELTLRQPLIETPSQDFVIGLTASRRESETALFYGEINGPFPLSPGADAQGRTRITALRFSQEWTVRNSRAVLAFRSQFSFGLDALGSTINPVAPDSRFFAWRGQAQWLRLLGSNSDPDFLLLLRGDTQLADRPLLSIEQFGIGGQDSVRGYRQDSVLTDNGIFTSAELRIPLFRLPQGQGGLQLTPFVEFGKGWNRFLSTPERNTLFSAGIGLRFRLGDSLTARFDWGIPLISASENRNTLQEQGLYFSVIWNPIRF